MDIHNLVDPGKDEALHTSQTDDQQCLTVCEVMKWLMIDMSYWYHGAFTCSWTVVRHADLPLCQSNSVVKQVRIGLAT